MPRRATAPLSEVLQLIQRQVVSREMQETVEQHRAVPGGQYKAISVRPLGVRRIMLQEARPQHKLVGLIAYGLYEEARREWVDNFKGLEKRFPLQRSFELMRPHGFHRD